MINFFIYFKCTYNILCGRKFTALLDMAFLVSTVVSLKPNKSLFESIIENVYGAVAKIVILK